MDANENSEDSSALADMFHTNQYVEAEETDDRDDCQVTENEPLREQDRFLPIANVARIMKRSVPASGKIAKDAKECVQECVSEFISFITSEASERCHQEKRKTINGEDILFAMSTLGFDNYVEPLKAYLQKYRETLHSVTTTKTEKLADNSELEGVTTEDDFNATTLAANLLDQAPHSQNVIYTTYTTGGQIPQSALNFVG